MSTSSILKSKNKAMRTAEDISFDILFVNIKRGTFGRLNMFDDDERYLSRSAVEQIIKDCADLCSETEDRRGEHATEILKLLDQVK
jgi:hypothetical protein